MMIISIIKIASGRNNNGASAFARWNPQVSMHLDCLANGPAIIVQNRHLWSYVTTCSIGSCIYTRVSLLYFCELKLHAQKQLYYEAIWLL